MAKALRDFARTNPNLVVKGGVLGTKPLTADEARALAEVEPREVLLAKLAGALAAPMVQFAGLLEALPRNFAYGLKALIDQQGGVPEDAGRRRARCGRRRSRTTPPRPRPPRPTDARGRGLPPRSPPPRPTPLTRPPPRTTPPRPQPTTTTEE